VTFRLPAILSPARWLRGFNVAANVELYQPSMYWTRRASSRVYQLFCIRNSNSSVAKQVSATALS
jgi:hypothetical protein